MEHTKGEWVINYNRLHDFPESIRIKEYENNDLMGDYHGCIVCDLTSSHGGRDHAKEEVEANARLIASAPDLLEACEELLIYINADNETKVLMYPESIELAKKAINKARGGK